MSSVLIVDDHAIAREPLSRLLNHEGFHTTCACNGVEALKALETSPADLVILDVMMPKMNGLLFLQTIRADARWTQLPVILLTGVLDANQISRAWELGVKDIIPKAKFSVDHLLDRIKMHVLPNDRRSVA